MPIKTMIEKRTPRIQNKAGTLTFDPAPVVRAMAIKGYTLDDVARRVGKKCSRNAVWRITNAKGPRPAYLHEVCKLLGVKIEDCYPLPETQEDK